MPSWVLRAEGVSFGTTIYDTNDLSTTRGASLALLRLKQAVEPVVAVADADAKQLFNGASQCAFRFQAPDAAAAEGVRQRVVEALRQDHAEAGPFSHLCFVVDCAADEGDPPPLTAIKDPALDRATAKVRTRQFRQWTVPAQPFHHDAKDADPLELIRPGTKETYLPPGKVLRPNEDKAPADAKSERRILSQSVAARRAFGRTARQQFYRDELGGGRAAKILGPLGEGLSFTNGFLDIVDNAPAGLPPSLRSKIAVVYADGNGFGGIRRKVPTKSFSEQVKTLRGDMLAAILAWYVNGAHGDRWGDFAVRDGSDRDATLGLRFETLLWGGDECVFVLPAWLALPFVSVFLNATKGWQVDGPGGPHKLTHAVGVAIAQVKTPIRQLQAIAKSAADLAKNAGYRSQNSVSFDIFESLAPPDTGLAPARARLYGMSPGDETAQARLAGLLALPGDQFDDLIERMRCLTGRRKGEPFPRSQFYAALRAARAKGDFTGHDAGVAAKASLDHFARRPEGEKLMQLLERNLPPSLGGERPLPLDLALITQLWDYVDPLGDSVDLTGVTGAA